MSRESLKIAITTSMFFPNVGGAEVFLHNLALSLQRRGHTPVVIASFSQWRAMWKRRDSLPYPILPHLPKQNALTRKSDVFLSVQDTYFALLQRRYDFDVWQSVGTFPVGVGVSHYTAAAGIPHVIRTTGSDIQKVPELDYGVRLDPEIEAVMNQHAAKCDRMVALTESVVPDCESVGVHRSDIDVIPCAVDLDRFDAIEVDEAAIRAAHDIPSDEFVFITVGRNHQKKGFPYLIDAAATLETRVDSPFHVVFVGSGMAPLRERAAEKNVESSVTFAGEISPDVSGGTYELPPTGVIELYKAADACVFPSLLETFGNVNIEAMAAGLSLISTDAAGSRDIVDHEQTGLVATAGDADSLATQMERMLTDSQLRAELRQAARTKVEGNYRWETVVEQYEDLYFELCR